MTLPTILANSWWSIPAIILLAALAQSKTLTDILIWKKNRNQVDLYLEELSKAAAVVEKIGHDGEASRQLKTFMSETAAQVNKHNQIRLSEDAKRLRRHRAYDGLSRGTATIVALLCGLATLMLGSALLAAMLYVGWIVVILFAESFSNPERVILIAIAGLLVAGIWHLLTALRDSASGFRKYWNLILEDKTVGNDGDTSANQEALRSQEHASVVS